VVVVTGKNESKAARFEAAVAAHFQTGEKGNEQFPNLQIFIV
jgi:hypothetical protein